MNGHPGQHRTVLVVFEIPPSYRLRHVEMEEKVNSVEISFSSIEYGIRFQ